MPKAPRAKTSTRTNPTSKPTTTTTTKNPESKPASSKPNTHLYTDDNPSTTLHGTGFKDAATAQKTLTLVSARSLTYQFQTVNTLYHRARNHPSVKKARSTRKDKDASNATDEASKGKGESESDSKSNGGPEGILAAIAIFATWLEQTYPSSKASLRANGGFKPLLSKKCVSRLLPALGGVSSEALEFAKLYVELPKNRRLGNVLLDEGKPGGKDWEVRRYEVLSGLVGEGMEEGKAWADGELWDGEGRLSARHKELVAWGWSPVGERKLERVEV